MSIDCRIAVRRAVATRTGVFARPEPPPGLLLQGSARGPTDCQRSAPKEILDMIAKANPEGSGARRTDFNSELLAHTLDSTARARLMSGLQRLVAAGLLIRHSESEYSITDIGAFTLRHSPP